MITDMQEAVHKAIAAYLDSGKADQLILDRLEKMNRRPCCEHCIHWDKLTMYCLDALSGRGTTYPSQVCDRFKEAGE